MSDRNCFIISFVIHLCVFLLLIISPKHTLNLGGASGGGSPAVVQNYIETELQQPEEQPKKQPKKKPQIAKNDDAFRAMMDKKPTEEPTPKASPTPSPSPKQTPTPTPKPTFTEKPSPTAPPKPTETEIPTATAKPSATPKPAATQTPKPTAAPKATATPKPVATPTPQNVAQNELIEILRNKLKETPKQAAKAKATPTPKAPAAKGAKAVPTPIDIAGKVSLDNIDKLTQGNEPKTPSNTAGSTTINGIQFMIGSGSGSGGGSGNGNGAGIGNGSGNGMGDGTEFSGYANTLNALLRRNWLVPSARRPELKEYKADFSFTINRNGNITDIKVETPSGWPLLDKSIIDAIQRSNPVPPLPPSYMGSEIRIIYPFVLPNI